MDHLQGWGLRNALRRKGLLNGLLYADLCEIVPAPEVYLFEDMVEGITHFVATTGVRAEKKLTPPRG